MHRIVIAIEGSADVVQKALEDAAEAVERVAGKPPYRAYTEHVESEQVTIVYEASARK